MEKSLGESLDGPLGKPRQARHQAPAAATTSSAPARLASLRHLEALVDGQTQVLEMISHGQPLADILEAITRWVEAQSHDEVLASLLLLDSDGQHLLHGAAPSLPTAYNAAIDGIEIGPAVGSCGTAAFTRLPVIVEDIAEDPRWNDLRALALTHGLRACWSTPLIGQSGQVLGTFALYYRTPRRPTPEDLHLIQLVSRTAILAIEHTHAQDERSQLRAREQAGLQRAEAERQRLHDLFMDAPAAMALMRGPTHVFELVNPLYQQVVGADRALLGQPIRAALPELAGQGFYEILDEVYTSGAPYEGTEVLVKLDRTGTGVLEDVYFSFVYQPMRDTAGAVDGILVHAVDMTASIRARRLVEDSERRYHTLFNDVPVAAYSCDANGVIQEYNQRAVALWGRVPRRGDPSERYCGSFKIHYPDGRPMPHDTCPMARVIQGGSVGEQDAEILVERPDGTRRNVLAFPEAVTNARGEIIGAINCLYDITERKRAEAAAAHLAAIVTSAEDAIASKTLDSIVTSWNASAERMFGYTAEEMIGQPIMRLIPHDRLDEEDLIITRMRAGQPIEHFETVRVRKDGHPIEVSLTISPIRDSTGTIVGASKIVRDITERRRLERRTRAALDALLELAAAMVSDPTPEALRPGDSLPGGATTTEDDTVRNFAALCGRVLACDQIAIVAVEPRTEQLRAIAMTGTSPEQEQRFRAGLADLRLADRFGADVAARLDSGEAVLVDMSRLPATDPARALSRHYVLLAPMRAADALQGYIGVKFGDEEERYTPENRSLALAVAQLVGIVLERSRLTREREEARAREAALLGANRRMDEFLSIASHELRTPLTSLAANVQLAERHLHALVPSGEPGDATPHGHRERNGHEAPPPRDLAKLERTALLLERTQRQVNRLDRLIGDLLDASRIQAGKLELRREPCDLLLIVREAVEAQRAAWPERTIRLITPPLPALALDADPDRLSQVVTNLLTNALKYAPPDQPVTVRVTREERREERHESALARVAVVDHGPGLSADQQTRLFERFYRVPGIEQQSGSGMGLGLGLHICKTIVERHDGQIGVESARGHGSTFWFTVPLDAA